MHAKRIHQHNFQFVTFAFLAIIRLKHSTDPSYSMEQCQQLVSVESIDIYKSTMGHSIMLVGIFFGIVLTFALYTLGIVCLGFSCGRRTNANRPGGGNDKMAIDKMTMSPVAYTSVRGVQSPRFEYSPIIDGCWACS